MKVPTELVVTLTTDQLKALVTEAVKEGLEAFSLPDEILNLKEAGELLKMHPDVLARKAADEEIPGHRAGVQWRFVRTELIQWVREQTARPKGGSDAR